MYSFFNAKVYILIIKGTTTISWPVLFHVDEENYYSGLQYLGVT